MENHDLPEDYEYIIDSGVHEGEGLVIRIKNVNSEEAAQTWFSAYSTTTLWTWKVSRTYPNAGRVNCYKKRYRCQHNVPCAYVENPKRIVESKNTKCPALLIITVKRVLKRSKSKNPVFQDQLNESWPCTVEFRYQHNHEMVSASVLKYRPLNDDTKNKLLMLFRKGHTVATALNSLKTELYLEKGDDYYLYAGNGSFLPTASQVQYLYNKEFSDIYGSKSKNLKQDLEVFVSELVEKYKEVGAGAITYKSVEGHNIVAVCTPLMCRVHEMIKQSSEMVFVDAAGGMDKLNTRVYFIMVPSVAGALPIGVILTDVESKSIFTLGLEELLKCFPTNSFFGKGYPSVIITDDDMKERGPLQSIFPLSHLLLCQFHILKAVWRWILLARNKIPLNDRQELYNNFKDLVYATDVDTLNSRYLLFLQNCKYQQFKTYIANEKWPKVKEWATVYHEQFLIRGNSTTNYVEIAFRLMKDVILNRVKAYNMVQLLDFIVTNLEAYYERRCLDFANGRYNKKLLKKFLCTTKNNIDTTQIITNSDDMYMVPSEREDNLFYTVCTSIGCCSCKIGISGKLCKHICIVLTHFKIDDNFYIVCEKTKAILFQVATNKEAPEGWLSTLKTQSIYAGNLYNKVTSSLEINENQKEEGQLIELSDVTTDMSHKKKVDSVLASNALSVLDTMTNRIKTGISNNPDVFIPALNKMVLNYENFAKTDHGLVSSMYNFGKHFNTASTMTERSGLKIHTQPTSVGRRKHKKCALGGSNSGRPLNIKRTLKNLGHDYTYMGTLPARKRKLRHSLQEAVYENKML